MTYHQHLSEIRSFLSNDSSSVPTERKRVIKDDGFLVTSYEDLATRVAELAFYNPQQVLLFRGHSPEKSEDKSCLSVLKPSLFQPVKERLPKKRLIQRMLTLKEAEIKLFDLYKESGLPNYQELARSKLKRWALLEHFGVCRTPLIEMTLSLRVAASIASQKNSAISFIYVLGIPSLAGAVTVDPSGQLHVIRLASVCPLSVESHHAIDSYMLGEYTNISEFETDQFAFDFDSNFTDRLLAKFRFHPKEFWDMSAPENCKVLLDTTHTESIFEIAQCVKNSLSTTDT